VVGVILISIKMKSQLLEVLQGLMSNKKTRSEERVS
jgi:hypothetical protein